MNKYIQETIKEARKSYKKGDVPVGAVIVKNNKIIAKAHNKKEIKQNVIKHAEIIAIEKACKKTKNWRLNDCEIYITMEPCLMCFGAILQSRIKKIVYCVENENFGCIKKLEKEIKQNKMVIEKEEQNKEIKQMLKEFFEMKR